MLPDDDGRHGTVAGYNRIPCRDECCRRAYANYRKRLEWDRANGRSRIVPVLGVRRRLQALNRLGWSNAAIAAHAGMHATNMTRLIGGETMTIALRQRLVATYEALCMTLPTGNKQAIANVRNRAERNGWLPPLAWDDIDDPDETPTDWRYEYTDRREVLRDLADMGLGITEAARRLHLSRDAVERYCARHGMSDVYRKLAAREALRENQHTRGAVA